MSIEWVPPTCLHAAGSGLGCGCAMAEEQTLDAAGKYIYMADLRKISAMKPLAEPVVPRALGIITTPFNYRSMEGRTGRAPRPRVCGVAARW